jgi:lysozyme
MLVAEGLAAMRALLPVLFASSLIGCVGDAPTDPTDGDGTAGAGLGSADTGAPTGTGLAAHATCAAGTTTPGVDVSYYNQTIDWPSVKTAGYEFAFIRVSDGATFHDPKFASNWAGAQAAGLVRGAYQFFRPTQSATEQADLMIAAIGTPGPGDLAPVIDVEVTGGLGPSAVAAAVGTWVDRVQAATGVTPIVYTGKYFWRDQVGGPSSFVDNPLWIAQYTSHCPTLPSPWTTWAFWQSSESGSVSGIPGAVDLDTFNGSLDELYAMTGLTGSGSGSGTDPGGDTSCTSQTMAADEPDGTCVEAAADQSWYQCTSGQWTAIDSPDASCTATYAWCTSATLGRDVPPRTCVQSAADSEWYQCDGTGWATGVDPTTATGPVGACSDSFPL